MLKRTLHNAITVITSIIIVITIIIPALQGGGINV